MKKAELYVWNTCPFCISAKRLLDQKGIEYEVHNIQNDKEKKKELFEQTGQNTVPYVFIDGEFVGGFDDLKQLETEGKL